MGAFIRTSKGDYKKSGLGTSVRGAQSSRATTSSLLARKSGGPRPTPRDVEARAEPPREGSSGRPPPLPTLGIGAAANLEDLRGSPARR